MKVKIIVLVFVMCFPASPALFAGGKEDAGIIQKKYLSGRTYFREGNYELAIKQFEAVVQMDPGYKVAAQYLEASKARFLKTSKKEASLQRIKKILAKVRQEQAEGPVRRYAEMKESRAKCLAEKKEKERIEREERKKQAILKREKEAARYYGLDEWEKVSQNARRMIARAEGKKTSKEGKESKKWDKITSLPSPKKEKAMSRIYMARGGAAYREGNYDTAIKEWEKASALDPANRTAQKRIDKVRQMVEKDKQAELEKARIDSAAQAKAAVKKYSARGKYLYRHKDYKGSVEEFRKALAIDPASKEAKKGLLKADRQLRSKEIKREKARRDIIDKTSKIVSKGNRYLVEKKFLKAKNCAVKALGFNPDSGAAKRLLEDAEKGLIRK